MGEKMKRYLLWSVYANIEFRLPEILSIADLFKLPIKLIEKCENKPYFIVEMTSEEDLLKLMSRTLLVKHAIELWAIGKNYETLTTSLRNINSNLMKLCYKTDTFCLRVETFGKRITKEEKVEKMERLSFLPFEGRINLENPQHKFQLLEYYGIDQNNVPDEPCEVFFGRFVAESYRKIIDQLSLKKRKFIANTSMEAGLSLLMANQAQIKENSLVYDPFVGTGSLLVAAAYFGAYVMGSDIDYQIIHGLSKPSRKNQKHRMEGESVLMNLHQYGLQSRYLDVFVGDVTNLPFGVRLPPLDAIVTDPPYGVREAIERVGTKKENYTVPVECLARHYPAKIGSNISDIYEDLLNFAARSLRLGGRLVFWLPVDKATFKEELVPTHPCLEIISNSEQTLTKATARRLITMSKTFDYSDKVRASVSDNMDEFRSRYFVTGPRRAEDVKRDESAEKLFYLLLVQRSLLLSIIFLWSKTE